MAPTIGGGHAATKPGPARPSRLSDFAPNNSQSHSDGGSQPPKPFGSALNGSSGWVGSTIWGNNSTLSSGLSSTTRDRSATRENTSLLSNGTEQIEGKTGSRSLLASSETEGGWARRSPWTDNHNANAPATATRRSSGVSPARQRPAKPGPHNIPFSDNSPGAHNLTSTSRTGMLGQDAYRSSSLQLDTISHDFSPPFENNMNGSNPVDRVLSHNSQRSQSLFNAWTDSGSVHSPADDRRSITNSEYFGGGSSSAAASRNGSLPPSRHGNEPPQYNQASDPFSRFAPGQLGSTGRGHTSSISSQSVRGLQNRTNSYPDDTASMIDRLSLSSGPASGISPTHRPTMSNASVPGSVTHMQNEHRHAAARASFMDQEHGFDNSNMTGMRPYTPDTLPYGPGAEGFSVPGSARFDRSGSTTESGDARSSNHYTANDVNSGMTLPRNLQSHPGILDPRLRGISQQDSQTYLNSQYPMYPPQQRYPSHFGQYAFHIPNGAHYSGLANQLPMGPFGNMMPMEPPRAPKEHDGTQGLRSAVLEDFKNNTKSGKRWELKDIYGYIVEFAGDQHGSRFIQQKLESANSEEKEIVFKELHPDSLQLMQDVFGNYVIQKFFEHGDQTQKKLLANRMQRKVFELSKQMYGCRVVQKALEHVLVDQQASLVKELEGPGLVMNCVKDQNGNHVIQKAIECVPAEHVQFIYDTFEGQIQGLAQHTYGCRVIQRMLENCEGVVKDSVLRELHACAPVLVTDQYGNYVTQHIIQHGRLEDRNKIVALVTANLFRNSTHKFASNVVEKCLIFGSDEQRRCMMRRILERPEMASSKESNVLFMIKDQYGNYVIQKMLDCLPYVDYFVLVDALAPEINKAKRSMSGGKQLLAVEKKMHRFEKKFDSPLMAVTGTSGASPVSPSADASAAATPPPPLSSDAQSLRSDSIPSTAMSAIDEPVTGMTAMMGKTPGVLIPQIGVTDTSE